MSAAAPKRIVIAAGGTAGHVVPAIAVAQELRAAGAQVSFIGGERAEAQLVPAAGFALERIQVEGLSRSNPLRALRAVALAVVAVPRSLMLLRRLRPDTVMGGGGYVAGPVGFAAVCLRIPLVLTEADSHLGLTNRLLARFARRVCLAFAVPGRDGSRYKVTGRPVAPLSSDRQAARARFGLTADATCVLVFGGSLGAHSINIAAIEAFAVPGAAVRVLHISGRRDYAELAGRDLPAGYELIEYLNLEDFADALAASDLVVARSGGSVFEIAAHGLPAILVPYPHAAGDHQTTNARWMADAGAAVVIADAELSGARLRTELSELLADRQRMAAMAAAAAGLARPDAALEVASELLAVAS
ncbi:MAG TPA: undecaprenyldiphospho-muramoylpentapeptide beta-N-acetylglucosaminyltransferase [Solirubrobacteraceae bacterium]|nr:undecaprenyldiphospho-muramoylpentapeptide beta-N-acetylglucosaminyltransferase [Solirubrobacteraceae bacterium]